MEDDKTGVCHARLGYRGVGDVVDRLVDGRVGVEVGAKLYAVALTPAAHGALAAVAVGEVACAVERHVLKKVCQSALLRLLQDGAHALRDVEVGLSRCLVVVPDIVGQSVWQRAPADAAVER